jgi:hypothetical protein
MLGIFGALLTACSSLIVVLDSFLERYPSTQEGKIELFIDNKTHETIVVFVTDYFSGVELARIPTQTEQKILVTKGRYLYIAGGNTQLQYRKQAPLSDGETWTIY